MRTWRAYSAVRAVLSQPKSPAAPSEDYGLHVACPLLYPRTGRDMPSAVSRARGRPSQSVSARLFATFPPRVSEEGAHGE